MSKQLLHTGGTFESILQKCFGFFCILFMMGQILVAHASVASTQEYLSPGILCLTHKPGVIARSCMNLLEHSHSLICK